MALKALSIAMTSKYFYLKHRLIYLISSFTFAVLALYLGGRNAFFYLESNLFSRRMWVMPISFLLTPSSLTFSSVVCLISRAVLMYSYKYLSPNIKASYYAVLVYLFVGSMLMVVNMRNYFYVMLGWDGLGIVSFFLIIYYGNRKSLYSGIFSLIMNRIGDSFFLVSIVLFFSNHSSNFFLSSPSGNGEVGLIIFMAVAFMTKTAIFPFSAWLPIAMAAPTPISALVHRSTLVTAGLFLFMRLSPYFLGHYMVMKGILVAAILTSFYAGVMAMFEMDFKKLIALSTLSHLGFILMAFALGLVKLAFFHLIAHALFKRLLFLSFGGMMSTQSHAQDGRMMRSAFITNPTSSLFMMTSLFNLLALPSMSGFYSKDYVLEFAYYREVSVVLYILMVGNVVLTYSYSLKLLSLLFKENNCPPYRVKGEFNKETSLFMSLLMVVMIVYGTYASKIISSVILPREGKSLPIFLVILMIGVISLTYVAWIGMRKRAWTIYFSKMMYLGTFPRFFNTAYIGAIWGMVNPINPSMVPPLTKFFPLKSVLISRVWMVLLLL